MPTPAPPGDLAVHDLGGPPGAPLLLLMHGLTDSGRCWPDAAARWTGRYRVLAWDARGHGDSPRFTDDELAAGVGETMLADAVALLERLRARGEPAPVLVGHSMGGGTAGNVAATRGDLVRGVVLEDPALGIWPGRERSERASRAAQWRADDASWRADPGARVLERRADPARWPDVEVAPWAAAKPEVDTRVLDTGMVAVQRSAVDVLRDLAAPTLLLTAGDDQLWPPSARRLLDALDAPGLTHVHLAEAEHCIRRTRPEDFHAVVDPWLAELLAGDEPPGRSSGPPRV